MDLAGPFRIDEQRAPDGDEVELTRLQTLDEIVDARRLGRFASEGSNELTREADAADRHLRLAGELLRPAGEIAIGSVTLRFPEAALLAAGADAGAWSRASTAASTAAAAYAALVVGSADFKLAKRADVKGEAGEGADRARSQLEDGALSDAGNVDG